MSGPIRSFLSAISIVLISPSAFIIKIATIGNITEIVTIEMITNPCALSLENPKI